MKKITFFLFLMAFNHFLNGQEAISDYDGNIYETVTIGTQVWLKENLRTTRLNDGSEIPLITENNVWSGLSTPGYCWYNNDSINKNSYGALYNWYTVNTDKICPIGWHVPSNTERMVLANFLGGVELAGGKMKETGTTHWNSPNTGASNSSGFTGLPGGTRFPEGEFDQMGTRADFWSSTETTSDRAIGYDLHYDNPRFPGGDAIKKMGFAIRCINNQGAGEKMVYLENKIKVFPNPSKNIINIYSENLRLDGGDYSIVDLIGINVQQGKLISNIIDISNINRGIYFLRINSDEALLSKKIVIE